MTLTCDYQQPHQPQQQQQIVTAFTADDSNSGGANTYFETSKLLLSNIAIAILDFYLLLPL